MALVLAAPSLNSLLCGVIYLDGSCSRCPFTEQLAIALCSLCQRRATRLSARLTATRSVFISLHCCVILCSCSPPTFDWSPKIAVPFRSLSAQRSHQRSHPQLSIG